MASILEGASEADLKRMATLWLYSDMAVSLTSLPTIASLITDSGHQLGSCPHSLRPRAQDPARILQDRLQQNSQQVQEARRRRWRRTR